jgi:HSP20 family protein
MWAPALDIVEKRDAYLVLAELPGVDRSQVDVNFEQNVLTIRGTKGTEARSADVRVFAAERVGGKFERTIRLPQFVDGDKISAEFVNGLLTITVPKAQAAQARKIELGN